MASGIENSSSIDLVTFDAVEEEVALIMIATNPWTEVEVLALQAKTQFYLDCVEGGELLGRYPLAKGKRLRFQLDASFSLSTLAKEFLEIAEEQWCKPLGIRFVVHEL